MSGRFTRRMYDDCAMKQNTKQSTDPLELTLDVTKYIHCNNICKPDGSQNYRNIQSPQYQPQASLVDIESSLMGIDKLSSKCDSSKHPFCGPNGCLLTNDPRISPHITPYACERGHDGDNAVVTTNMIMPRNSGFTVPTSNICGNANTNGYYTQSPMQQQRISLTNPPMAPMSSMSPMAPMSSMSPMSPSRTPILNQSRQIQMQMPPVSSPLARSPKNPASQGVYDSRYQNNTYTSPMPMPAPMQSNSKSLLNQLIPSSLRNQFVN